MKKKNVLLSFCMMIIASLFLAACGESSGGDGDTKANGGEEPEFLSILTGGTSGTYFPLGGEIAKIISDETGIQTDSVASNASADNVVDLQEGEAEIAFSQTDVMAYAVEGIHAFDGNPVDNVLAIGSLYPETIQIVTTSGQDWSLNYDHRQQHSQRAIRLRAQCRTIPDGRRVLARTWSGPY